MSARLRERPEIDCIANPADAAACRPQTGASRSGPRAACMKTAAGISPASLHRFSSKVMSCAGRGCEPARRPQGRCETGCSMADEPTFEDLAHSRHQVRLRSGDQGAPSNRRSIRSQANRRRRICRRIFTCATADARRLPSGNVATAFRMAARIGCDIRRDGVDAHRRNSSETGRSDSTRVRAR